MGVKLSELRYAYLDDQDGRYRFLAGPIASSDFKQVDEAYSKMKDMEAKEKVSTYAGADSDSSTFKPKYETVPKKEPVPQKEGPLESKVSVIPKKQNKEQQLNAKLGHVAFDLDDCIADSNAKVESEILSKHGHDVNTQTNRTFFIDVPGVSSRDLGNLVDDVIKSGDYDPLPGAIPALKKYYKMTGRPIQIVTARPPDSHEATKEWLDRELGDTPYSVRFVTSSSDKWKVMPHNIKFYVDDRLKTANDLASRGYKVYLMDKPWNQGRETHEGVTRIHDLGDVVTDIQRQVKKMK